MGDTFTEVTRTGFLDNVGNSIKGVLVGVILFFLSFPLLWWNEGRTNWAEVAKTSVVAPEKPDAAFEGKFVSVTGPMDSTEEVGDPDFVRPGPWLTLERNVEMFAWKETKHTKEEKELGGGKKTTTTYEYNETWVAAEDVQNSSNFKVPAGHQNPSCPVSSKDFRVKNATIAGYSFEAPNAQLPRGDALNLTPPMLASAGPEATGTTSALAGRAPTLDSNYLFSGKGSLQSPSVGDLRIAFRALARGLKCTMFGQQTQNALTGFVYKDERPFLRALKGTRDEAIAELSFEDAVLRWILRGVGFLAMWIGMTMILGPISAVADVIPFLGSASRFLVGVVTFPIAAVLTIVTIVLSLVFHSPIALAIVAGIVLLMGVYVVTRKKRAPGLATG